jgi:outer membrane murein-binding lipoprotein Lpp|tara:strand:+ start:12278 stop:12493 length:216 start_codon:yes stop_codon:yes gene_type:complete
MKVKSTTQMTKAELLELINDKNTVIADLNARMDELESMAVVSRAEILDADTSRLLSTMNARIKALEEKLEA